MTPITYWWNTMTMLQTLEHPAHTAMPASSVIYARLAADLQTQHGLRRKLIRRSKMETCCEILRAMGKGAVKGTHIVHKANLNWKTFSESLDLLKTLEYVSEQVSDHGGIEYHLTDKGFGVLNMCNEMRDCLILPER
jgi:predicted transcriptional regulator